MGRALQAEKATWINEHELYIICVKEPDAERLVEDDIALPISLCAFLCVVSLSGRLSYASDKQFQSHVLSSQHSE